MLRKVYLVGGHVTPFVGKGFSVWSRLLMLTSLEALDL